MIGQMDQMKQCSPNSISTHSDLMPQEHPSLLTSGNEIVPPNSISSRSLIKTMNSPMATTGTTISTSTTTNISNTITTTPTTTTTTSAIVHSGNHKGSLLKSLLTSPHTRILQKTPHTDCKIYLSHPNYKDTLILFSNVAIELVNYYLQRGYGGEPILKPEEIQSKNVKGHARGDTVHALVRTGGKIIGVEERVYWSIKLRSEDGNVISFGHVGKEMMEGFLTEE